MESSILTLAILFLQNSGSPNVLPNLPQLSKWNHRCHYLGENLESSPRFDPRLILLFSLSLKNLCDLKSNLSVLPPK